MWAGQCWNEWTKQVICGLQRRNRKWYTVLEWMQEHDTKNSVEVNVKLSLSLEYSVGMNVEEEGITRYTNLIKTQLKITREKKMEAIKGKSKN